MGKSKKNRRERKADFGVGVGIKRDLQQMSGMNVVYAVERVSVCGGALGGILFMHARVEEVVGVRPPWSQGEETLYA